jgi:O-acetyl-ADP-ribose deacetylase
MISRKIISALSAFAICGTLSLSAAVEKPKANVVVLKDGTVTIKIKGSPTKIEIPPAGLNLTEFKVDAIVNPANTMLQHGAGVAGAISKAAGPKLQKWSDNVLIQRNSWDPRYRRVRLQGGRAMISPSFDLIKNDVTAIIHIVGPDMRVDHERKHGDTLLYNAWYNALKIAATDACIKTIAFPSISTGIFGFPKERAGEIALQAISDFIQKHPHRFERIYILLWPDTRDAYVNAISTVLEPTLVGRIGD